MGELIDILHEIIGEKVKHKLFGDGTITNYISDKIYILFIYRMYHIDQLRMKKSMSNTSETHLYQKTGCRSEL